MRHQVKQQQQSRASPPRGQGAGPGARLHPGDVCVSAGIWSSLTLRAAPRASGSGRQTPGARGGSGWIGDSSHAPSELLLRRRRSRTKT